MEEFSSKFLKILGKIPAGIMIIPLLLGALINTFCPQILQIGTYTTATFTSAGTISITGVFFVCVGAQLQFREIPRVLRRGGTLLLAKFAIGALLGIVVGKVFGSAGFLGLSSLAIISAVTNSNGGIYVSLMKIYGDDIDVASVSLLSINDGPFLTLVAMGTSGLASINLMALLAAVMPILVGMVLGNFSSKIKSFLDEGTRLLIPFIGFCLGGGINLYNIVKSGFPGILLGLICAYVGGVFILLCDKLIAGRPGYAAWAVSTTAGNAVLVPAVVAEIDPTLKATAAAATPQVAAAVVVTAILAPIMTNLWAKKFGCPAFPAKTKQAQQIINKENQA